MSDLLMMLSKGSVEVRLQEASALVASLDAASVQVVLTDPPYGISYQSNRRKEGKGKPIAADWNFQIGPFLRSVERVLKPGGVCYLFTRWDIFPLWALDVPPGLKLKNFIIWNKDNHSAGDLAGNFGFKWEGIMMLVKGRHLLRGPRHSNVWDCPRVPFKELMHPAEKPVALLQKAIEASSDPGDLVVDPFCGSGATGEAALLGGRNAILGDVDKAYVCAARRRLGLPEGAEGAEPEGAEGAEPGRTAHVEVNMDPLEGVHPEDIAALAAYFQAVRLPDSPMPPEE